MNAARRKSIKAVIAKLEEAQQLLQDAAEDLQQIQEAEQEAFDNMPESLQESERGETMENNIDELDEIISSLNDDLDIDDLTGRLADL